MSPTRTDTNTRSETSQKERVSAGVHGADDANRRDAEELVSQLKELPDIRSERVEALRQRIEEGTYKPTAQEIAEAIVKDES